MTTDHTAPQGQREQTYRQYKRAAVAELADWHEGFDMAGVSISEADAKAGSPKPGDKIARNPANHDDRWLVAADYFAANFESRAPTQEEGSWLQRMAAAEDECVSVSVGGFAVDAGLRAPTQEEGEPDALSAAYDAGYALAKRLVQDARRHAYGEGYVDGKEGRPATGPKERVYVPATVPTPQSAEVEALVSILRRIGGRRSWCGRCESFDHECGCTPNVSERRVTEELAALRTKGGTE